MAQEAVTMGDQPAGFASRLVAFVIDLVIVTACRLLVICPAAIRRLSLGID